MEGFENLLKKPVFDSLPPERREMLSELMKRLDGRSTAEAVGIMADFVRNMPKGGELPSAQQNAMIEAVLETMPENERNRIKGIIKMMEAVNG